MRRFYKASSILEYVLLAAVILVVLMTMGGYIKRGLMYKYKQSGDAFGDGRQYEPCKCLRWSYKARLEDSNREAICVEWSDPSCP